MWKERTEKKKFEEGFGEDVKEIYALTQDDVGSCRMKGECCWTASIRLLAYVDVKTAELKQEKRMLQWMLSDRENKKPGKVFRLKKETIYHLTVRESLPKKNEMVRERDACRYLAATGGCAKAGCEAPAAAGAVTGISEACLFTSVRYLSATAQSFPESVSGRGGVECATG